MQTDPCSLFPNPYSLPLRSSRELPCLGVDFNFFAHLNVERRFDLQAGLEPRQLGDVAAGVAARAGFGVLNLQLDLGRQLQADGIAVELVQLDPVALDSIARLDSTEQFPVSRCVLWLGHSRSAGAAEPLDIGHPFSIRG